MSRAAGSPGRCRRTADFARIAAEGEVAAEAEHDYCVKPVATGLQPGTWYHYRFRDSRGAVSAVGRTRTLPEGRTPRFTLGIFSCANLAFGFFNAYAHAAARRDLDLLVHLGDYLYEFERGKYPSGREALAGRVLDPAHEAVALADYRLRHAAYRADPDLQRLHASAPMVMMWDDHETANDAWSGGAENHDPAKEGTWDARKSAALRAYREWLPVSDNEWESYEIGDLATLFRPETRLAGRSRPLVYAEAVRKGEDLKASLMRFRDAAWRDPDRTMLGPEQEAWLAGSLRRSAGQGTRWQLLAQQTVMGSWALPVEARAWMRADAPDAVKRITAIGAAASEVGPAAQPRRLGRLSRRPRAAAPLRPRCGRQFDRPLRRQPQRLGLRPRPRRHPRRRRVRRDERHLARPRSLCPGRRPGRGRTRRPRPQPGAQMGRPRAAGLSHPDPDAGARHRRMAVAGNGADPLHPPGGAPCDERETGLEQVHLR